MNTKIVSFTLMLMILTGCQSTPSKIIEPTPTIFNQQAVLEASYQKDYESSLYTLDSPYLIHDPYSNSPLSYLLRFETEEPVKIRYQVSGHTPETTLTFETAAYETSHLLILTGLYPNEENSVLLTAINQEGVETNHPLQILTPSLPDDILDITVTKSHPSPVMNRLFLMTDDHYKYLIDSAGEIRWLQTSTSGSITPLKNGNLLTYNGPYYFYYQQRLEEIDYLGKVQNQIYIPGSGHHSLSETQLGDYVINSSDKSNERYTEDVIYVIDPQTGDVSSIVNLRDYLDVNRFNKTLPTAVTGDMNDWFHLNYAMLDETDQTFIASGRSQSMVVKIDPNNQSIKWILGAPDEVSEVLQPYLLTPTGDSFTWPFAQHSAKVIEDLDQNPDTTDLILFDNHVDIGVFPKQSYPDLNKYSRAVHYRINEKDMTIEQIWSFGEALLPPLFSTIISEIDHYPSTKTMLVLYGFLQQNQLTGGKLFEVDAQNSADILFEMELFKEGVNHLYTMEALDFSNLNLTTSPQQTFPSISGAGNLNLFKTSFPISSNLQLKTYSEVNINGIELSDDVLKLDGYIVKENITDLLGVVLTDESGVQHTFTIHPADTYPVKSIENLPDTLQKKYKKAFKSQQLYQYVDRTDLSTLPAGIYHLSLYLESNQTSLLYETPYEINLTH